MHLKQERITPTKARTYLDTNHESQRHLKQGKVNQFISMMENGEFNGENGETIKFAKNGKGDVLIDGQHRLAAILEYGKPVSMYVLRGLKTEAFKTIDQGETRTVENFYQIANQSHAKICAQVAKWLFYAEQGGSPLRWYTNKQGPVPVPGVIAEYGLKNYSDLPEVVDRVSEYLNFFQKKGLGTKNHLAYCYYIWQKIDPIEAYEIVKYLGSGEGTNCQTIVSLREWLMLESKKDRENQIPGTVRGLKILNALNTGWNAVRDGKKNVKVFGRLVSKFAKTLSGKGNVSTADHATKVTLPVDVH